MSSEGWDGLSELFQIEASVPGILYFLILSELKEFSRSQSVWQLLAVDGGCWGRVAFSVRWLPAVEGNSQRRTQL